jgi:hypothetical protein
MSAPITSTSAVQNPKWSKLIGEMVSLKKDRHADTVDAHFACRNLNLSGKMQTSNIRVTH